MICVLRNIYNYIYFIYSKYIGGFAVTMPPLPPSDIIGQFALLETQLDAPVITSDAVKFAIIAKSLEEQLSQQIEGIITDRPAGGGYAKLMGELIRASAEHDSNRVSKLVGS